MKVFTSHLFRFEKMWSFYPSDKLNSVVEKNNSSELAIQSLKV